MSQAILAYVVVAEAQKTTPEQLEQTLQGLGALFIVGVILLIFFTIESALTNKDPK